MLLHIFSSYAIICIANVETVSNSNVQSTFLESGASKVCEDDYVILPFVVH